MSFTISPTIGPSPPFPQIDYTDKDYASFRQALIDIAPTNVPEWTSRSESDFLMVMIELFSYVGDVLSYYTDRVANEAYLPTAQLRSSVLNIAALMDYQPSGFTAAQGTEQFAIRTGTGPVTVPKGTQVAVPASATQDQVVFETEADLIIYGNAPPSVTDQFSGSGAANQGYQLRSQYSGSGAALAVSGATWSILASLDANNQLTGDAIDFEGGTGGWVSVSNCTVTQSALQAYRGTHSLALTAAANGTMTAASPWVPCAVGAQPMCTGAFRANSTTQLVTLSFEYADVNFTSLGTSTGDAGVNDSTTAWITGHTFVGSAAPTNTAYCRMRVTFTCVAGGVHFVDIAGTYQNATAGGPTGRVATLTQQSGSIWKLTFGDGVTGAEPANAAVITITYTLPVTSASYAGSVAITQGQTISSEVLGQSTGGIDQDFTLFQSPVIDGSVQVSVDEGLGQVEWNFYTHISDALATDPAYTLSTDSNGITHVVFGDGTNGRIPVTQSTITASYRQGGGIRGNVGAGTITQIINSVNNLISATNPSATAGGADAESIDHIRRQAPKSLSAVNRAVTTADYAALALKVPGVSKASATGAVYTSVMLYVHPTGGFLPTSGTGPTLQSLTNALIPFITNPPTNNGFLDSRIMIGTTVTVLPPQYNGGPGYVPVNITASVGVIPTMAASVVQQSVITALAKLLSFDNVDFGSRVALSQVYQTINAVPGVDFATVSLLWRADQASGLGDVVCAASEMPALGNVTISTTGGIPA